MVITKFDLSTLRQKEITEIDNIQIITDKIELDISENEDGSIHILTYGTPAIKLNFGNSFDISVS